MTLGRRSEVAHRWALLVGFLGTVVVGDLGEAGDPGLQGEATPSEGRPEASSQPGPGEVELVGLISRGDVDPWDAFDFFEQAEKRLTRCYQAVLPRRVDRRQDQGDVDVAMVLGTGGHIEQVVVHGRPESLEHYRRCVLEVVSGHRFGEPNGHGGELGVHLTFSLSEDLRDRPRRPGLPVRHIYPRVSAPVDDDNRFYARIWVLNRVGDVEQCYQKFGKRRNLDGFVELRVVADEWGQPTIEASASTPSLRMVSRCVARRAEQWSGYDDVVDAEELLEVVNDVRSRVSPRAL